MPQLEHPIRAQSHAATYVARNVVAGAVLLVLTGCGGSGLPMVPVHGKVTFNGGPCPAAGNVGFAPIEVKEGLPRRPGTGHFREDGDFVVSSFGEGDGLIPGRYRVTVMCFSGLPNPTSPDPWGDVSYVPKNFQAPELVVEEGSDGLEVTYDVPLKQVKGGAAARM